MKNEKNNISTEVILNSIDKLMTQEVKKTSKTSKGLFTIKTANSWIQDAKNRPIPSMLFSEFWFEGELCILFADTNLGKSILAVQIGNSISNGTKIYGFKLESSSQSILYFDFELSDKQFENRYSEHFQNHHHFNEKFKRVEINPDASIPKNVSFEDYLNESLEKSLVETNTKILIIDNLTYLKNETENAKHALPLMKQLKSLKTKYNLSILVLAHTPKRDLSKPITRNDLAGSKMLINFCDSVFTIGESNKDKSMRYLKQIKSRNTEIIYDSENIMTCQIAKPKNFLKFDFIEFGSEREHLKEFTEKDREVRIEEAIELKKQGCTNVDIAFKYGVSEGAVRKWFKKIDN